MFNPDKPIERIKEDILGRDEFSINLGEAILSYKSIDSTVIGLYGSWGYGKSSIINMTIEYIESQKENKPIVFKFNPWNYSNQKQLIAQFFNQLSQH